MSRECREVIFRSNTEWGTGKCVKGRPERFLPNFLLLKRTSSVLGVDVISDDGSALTSSLLLRQLGLLRVGVDLLGVLGVLGSNGVGHLGGLLTSTLQTSQLRKYRLLVCH